MITPHYNDDRLSSAFYNAWVNRQHERYHAIQGDEKHKKEILEIADYQSNLILEGATDLISSRTTKKAHKLYDQLINFLIDADKPQDTKDIAQSVFDIIDEKIGLLSIQAQAKAENRIYHLLAFMDGTDVSIFTKKYIRWAVKCYLFGFDEQCVIMCRSILESAFMHCIPDSLCKKILDSDMPPYYLGSRIKAARELKRFNAPFFDAVKSINDTARDLIHPDRKNDISLKECQVRDILMKTIVCTSILEQEDCNG